jgi:hypothetical protein
VETAFGEMSFAMRAGPHLGEIMNTRCTLAARITALAVIIAALFLIPAAGRAQLIDCNQCDHITFAVRADMGCDITVCFAHSPGGPALCTNVAPGNEITINCPISELWVNTCSGPYYLVPSPVAARCTPLLKFAAQCCGTVCVVPSVDLCTRLEVRPAPCLSRTCP